VFKRLNFKYNTTVLISILAIGLSHTSNAHESGTTQSHLTDIQVVKYVLPPLPNNAKAGLMGTDSNNNGVRDDVEIIIHTMYPHSEERRNASLYGALMLQRSLIANEHQKANDGHPDLIANMISCYKARFTNNWRKESAKLKSLTFNTIERVKAWRNYAHQSKGPVQVLNTPRCIRPNT
jgi:hypothetical protein